MKFLSQLTAVMLVSGLFLSATHLKAEEAKASPKPAVKKYRTLKKTHVPKKGAVTTVKSPEVKPAASSKVSLQVWLNRLKKKVQRAESKHTKLVAVASVRGDESTDAPPLYWKGHSSEGPVALPELKEFDDAINTALNGDAAGAKTKLEGFLSSHPESPLVAEAKETLGLLSENIKP